MMGEVVLLVVVSAVVAILEVVEGAGEVELVEATVK